MFLHHPLLWASGFAGVRLLLFPSKATRIGSDSRRLDGERRAVRASNAFTLLELLLVIAIIGLLAGLMMPAVSLAKNRVWRASDLNNLRQMEVACHLVTTDNNDVMPTANWLSLDQVGNPPQGWLYTYDSSAVGPARFPVQSGSFYPLLQNSKMYFCPGDGTNGQYFDLRPQQSSSYVINGAVCGFGATATMVKETSLPPTGAAFWECNNSTPDDNTYLFNDGANYPSGNRAGRHGRVTPVALFDGSAQLMELVVWAEKVAETNANELWCYPGSANGR